MKILIFLHGTLIMHKAGLACSREERVRQVEQNHPSVHLFELYVPIGNAVSKTRSWVEQGAEIIYLSSNLEPKHLSQDRSILERHGFPHGEFLFRGDGETYPMVAERVAPDLIIEDNCESIGGVSEMVWPNLSPEAKADIRSVTVKEFEGIDHLPANLSDLGAIAHGVFP